MPDLEVSVNLSASTRCWNQDALRRHASDPGFSGRIACGGCVENPIVGWICSAEVNGQPACAPNTWNIGTMVPLPGTVAVQDFRMTRPL